MMDGLLLLTGHLIGDYIVQNDWMAANKTNGHPGPKPADEHDQIVWRAKKELWQDGHVACTVHCLLYTLAVWACSFWWMPWWGLVACFALHWPIDRFRLAHKVMTEWSGQKMFAEKMGPWSVIIVDNTWHLITLGVIAKIAY